MDNSKNNSSGPCLLCKKELESALPDNLGNRQPYAGGEIRFIFGYGSTKFDNNITGSIFTALICDDCAEKYILQMDQITEDHRANPPRVSSSLSDKVSDSLEDDQGLLPSF